jgi:hypothetical protein
MFSGWLFAKQKEDLVTESLTLGQSSDRPDSKKNAPAASSIGLLLKAYNSARSTLRAVVAGSNQSISNVALGAFFAAGAALLPRCDFTSQLCVADVTTLCFGARRSVR